MWSDVGALGKLGGFRGVTGGLWRDKKPEGGDKKSGGGREDRGRGCVSEEF